MYDLFRPCLIHGIRFGGSVYLGLSLGIIGITPALWSQSNNSAPTWDALSSQSPLRQTNQQPVNLSSPTKLPFGVPENGLFAENSPAKSLPAVNLPESKPQPPASLKLPQSETPQNQKRQAENFQRESSLPTVDAKPAETPSTESPVEATKVKPDEPKDTSGTSITPPIIKPSAFPTATKAQKESPRDPLVKSTEPNTVEKPVNNISTPPNVTTNTSKDNSKDNDVLFDDDLMEGTEKDIENPNLDNRRTETTPIWLGKFSETLQAIDDQARWVEDALQTSVLMDLKLPVRQVHQDLFKVHINQQRARYYDFKEKQWERDYELQQAQEILNKSKRAVQPANLVEGRSIWLDRGSIVNAKSPHQLKALIRRLHKAGLNIIYFETLNAGYPIYPSAILPQNPLISGWDPLAVAIEESHALGMELHAWVWCFAVGNTKHNPLVNQPDNYPGPILQEAGLVTDALEMRNGSIMPPGQTEYWLSPASPKARDFLTSVYKEIVEKYDVDGLQLDYIRYPFQRLANHAGYESVSRQRFSQDTGYSLGGDYSLKAFIAWKALQVNSFVKQVSETLRPIKPNLKISAAVFPMKRAERLMAIQQDWETWIKNGWVEILNPMIYTSSPYLFHESLNRIVKVADHQAQVYPGIAIFRLDPNEMIRHLSEAEDAGAGGSTLFANAQLDKDKQELLKEGPYKNLNPLFPHRNPQQNLIKLATQLQTDLKQFQANTGDVIITASTTERCQACGSYTPSKSGQTTSLNQVLNELEQLTALLNSTKPASAAVLENRFMLVQQTLEAYLAPNTHRYPYRTEWFKRYLDRMNQQIRYASRLMERSASEPTSF